MGSNKDGTTLTVFGIAPFRQATLSCDISPLILLTLLSICFPANQIAVSLYAVFNYAVNSWEDLRVTATNRLYRTELRRVVSLTYSIFAL